ncbi:MAG: transglutaminase-like domain-containing protein [Acidobacteriota bacterium]
MTNFLWNAAIAAIWGLAAAALASELSTIAGVAASILGAAAAVFVARRVADSSLRLPVIWASCLAILAVILLGTRWVTAVSLASALLGPSASFTAGEFALWLGGPLLVVLVLRTSTLRYRALLGLELAAAAAVCAGIFAAHRGGFINRPYALVDGLWAQGYDPVPVFLALGVLIAAALVSLVFHRGSTRRSPLNLVLLLVLIALVFVVFPIGKLKEFPSPQGGGSSPSSGKGKGSGGEQETKGKKEGTDRGGQSGGGGRSGQSGGADHGGQSGGSGSSGTMESLDNLPSSADNPPMAVIIFRDDYATPLGYYYFRQTAFSQFNGRRLVQDTSGLADKDILDTFPARTTQIPTGVEQAESAGREGKPDFEFLSYTVALLASHNRPFFLVNGISAAPRANPDPNRFLRAFDARSAVITKNLPGLTQCRLGSATWGPDLWKHYTEASTDPRYAELAGGIVKMLKPEFADMPIAKALAVKMWLEKNGTYSLQSEHEKSEDPLGDFLFGDRIGHCVYFAHSAAMLIRSLGIPARVGAGYAVDARNRGEGSTLMIRGKDAHAWPEIYLDGLGWIPFDIAPEKSLAPPEEAPDQGLQQMLGEMVREGAGNPRDEHKAAARGDLQEAVRRLLKQLIVALPFLLVAILALVYLVKLYRRLVPFYCRPAGLPRLAFRASLDCLAEAGRLRGYGQTREAFAKSVAPKCPSFLRLTEIHLDGSLGRGSGAVQPQECLRLYRGASRQILKMIPWWRRPLAAMRPFIWLRVK